MKLHDRAKFLPQYPLDTPQWPMTIMTQQKYFYRVHLTTNKNLENKLQLYINELKKKKISPRYAIEK